jgi:hypothetical protein
MTRDDAIVFQGPVSANLFRDVLEPDPARSIRMFDDAETSWRCQAARQVIQPP